jgi:adenylate cyclase
MQEPDAQHIQAISDWLIEQGLLQAPIDTMLAGFCDRLFEAGVPLLRANVSTRTMHPLIDSISHVWRRGGKVDSRTNTYEEQNHERWLHSPLRTIVETMDTRLHRTDLTDPAKVASWPVFEEFRREGATEHALRLIGFGVNGTLTGQTGLMMTWLTDRPGGFSTRDMNVLERLMPRLALSAKSTADHEIAVNLLDTYVGHEAGTAILGGSYRRGSFRIIPAAILFADLRGFSAISDRLDRVAMADLLNTCFDAMVNPIRQHGGEVLKFLGDGLLAVFDRQGHEDGDICFGALHAAVEACKAVAAVPVPDRPGNTMELDVALHLGEVYYGNVGSADRLDFTVLGPAVNEAARIEALCTQLDSPILISQSFADAAVHCSAHIVPAGCHVLRGVPDPVALYRLSPAA